MNASPALLTHPSSPVKRNGEVGLAALFDLCVQEEIAHEPRPPLPTFRDSLSLLRDRARSWARRGAAWGAGPGGAWRAW